MPDRSEWGTVWLGASDIADENNGWYPILGDVKVAQLAVFERKITIGDATKDTEDFISSWIMGDFTGGGQIETINEGSDGNRYWWAENIDTRSPNAIVMPPPITELTQSGVSSTAISYPLGDVYATDNISTRVAVAFGTAVYLNNNSTSTFSAPGTVPTLGAAPVNRGVTFQGSAAFPRLYVPLGSYGYATVIDNGTTGATVTNVPSSGLPDPKSADLTLKPKAQAFAVWNSNLYCLDTRGYLWLTTDGSVWNGVSTNIKTTLKLDEARLPRTMVTYVNKAGDPTLHVITDRDVWQYDYGNNRLVQTSLQFPPHPEFGKVATVWRPGEDLWITAGQDCVKYTAAGVIVPFAGLARDDGLPSNVTGPITDLCAEASTLFAVTSSKTLSGGNCTIQLHVWTGTGWHSMWTKTVRDVKPWLHLSVANSKYRLWIGSRAASTTGSVFYIDLEPNMYNPRTQRSDFFTGTYQRGNGKLLTGIFDAAMSGFRKLASHVTVQMAHASSTQYLDVYMETDEDRAAGTGSVYVGRVNADGRTVIPLKRTGTFSTGIPFNDVRFELRFVNGTPPSGAANTLAMESFAMHYTKIPQNTASYAFTVPLPKEGWHGRGPTELADGLYGMLTSGAFMKFVHNGREERVRVAGVSGAGATGEDMSGALQVSLIAVRAD